jgi:hypothetical protein
MCGFVDVRMKSERPEVGKSEDRASHLSLTTDDSRLASQKIGYCLFTIDHSPFTATQPERTRAGANTSPCIKPVIIIMRVALFFLRMPVPAF